MPSKHASLTACLDANVIISAIVFGGIPGEILKGLFLESFLNVTAPNIVEEVRRNLTGKLKMNSGLADIFLMEFIEKSSFLKPAGNLKVVSHPPDNLVLELAILGDCDVLVTGDKRHLLPLKFFNRVIIESPAQFLKRLDTLKKS